MAEQERPLISKLMLFTIFYSFELFQTYEVGACPKLKLYLGLETKPTKIKNVSKVIKILGNNVM